MTNGKVVFICIATVAGVGILSKKTGMSLPGFK